MEDNKNMQNEGFAYTYSAKQQEELKAIREKYMPPVEDKMEKLRSLDASVTKKATMVSIIVGVVSTLIMGFGMTCCMEWGDNLFILGIIIGLIGIVGVALAYPIYNRIVKKEREKIAPEILRLTEELMK